MWGTCDAQGPIGHTASAGSARLHDAAHRIFGTPPNVVEARMRLLAKSCRCNALCQDAQRSLRVETTRGRPLGLQNPVNTARSTPSFLAIAVAPRPGRTVGRGMAHLPARTRFANLGNKLCVSMRALRRHKLATPAGIGRAARLWLPPTATILTMTLFSRLDGARVDADDRARFVHTPPPPLVVLESIHSRCRMLPLTLQRGQPSPRGNRFPLRRARYETHCLPAAAEPATGKRGQLRAMR